MPGSADDHGRGPVGGERGTSPFSVSDVPRVSSRVAFWSAVGFAVVTVTCVVMLVYSLYLGENLVMASLNTFNLGGLTMFWSWLYRKRRRYEQDRDQVS